jgi:hypothetical protein
MLHEVLVGYLDSVERSILQCSNAYVECYTEEILTPERANLRIHIRFSPGHLLEISEAIVIAEDSVVHLDYRYHCQDEQNRLIFRYDSTPHFRGLSTFPHHKHLPETVIPCDKPEIGQAVQKAMKANTIRNR